MAGTEVGEGEDETTVATTEITENEKGIGMTEMVVTGETAEMGATAAEKYEAETNETTESENETETRTDGGGETTGKETRGVAETMSEAGTAETAGRATKTETEKGKGTTKTPEIQEHRRAMAPPPLPSK